MLGPLQKGVDWRSERSRPDIDGHRQDYVTPAPVTLIREANALREAGHLPEAEAAYLRILDRWPALPDCWFNLAVVQRRSGRYQAALASYQEALARGVARLSDLLPRGAHAAGLIARLREAIARPEASAADRAQLGFALGRALDANGDYGGAFSAYQAANRDSRASALPAVVRYDRAAQE